MLASARRNACFHHQFRLRRAPYGICDHGEILLVDGRRLADLMIEYEVGITACTVKIPKLQRDCFDGE